MLDCFQRTKIFMFLNLYVLKLLACNASKVSVKQVKNKERINKMISAFVYTITEI